MNRSYSIQKCESSVSHDFGRSHPNEMAAFNAPLRRVVTIGWLRELLMAGELGAGRVSGPYLLPIAKKHYIGYCSSLSVLRPFPKPACRPVTDDA